MRVIKYTGLAVTLALGTAISTGAFAAEAPLYTVVDGVNVDSNTYQGFKTWRQAACDRCHGPNQEGLVGPSLVESLKVMSKADFVKTLAEGRLDKGMPSWSTNKNVMDHIDNLYAYLKGRSDGKITESRVHEIAPQ